MKPAARDSICIIQGHPHGSGQHLCHAIAEAYSAGARASGAKVELVDIAAMDIAPLRDPADFVSPPPADVLAAQEAVKACNHLVVVYPLWLGTMPGLVKCFFEHLARNHFAIGENPQGGWPLQMLKGRSARVIVTMGMPVGAYKLVFGAHGVRSFESGILGMSGIKPVRETLIGGVGALTPRRSELLLARMRRLGEMRS